MAFFLVPIALLAVSAAAGAKGAHDTYRANETRKEAAARRERAQALLDEATRKTEQAVEHTRDAFGRLALVRMSAQGQLSEVVDWIRRGKVKEIAIADFQGAEAPDLDAWRNAGVEAQTALSGVLASAAGAAGARSLAMTAAGYGTASTGAAITGLSGAAARNAALAWLGGGSLVSGGGGMALGTTVLGGLNVGFLALGVGFTARKMAAAADASSRDFEAACETEAQNQHVIRKSMAALRKRADQVRRAINAVAHATRRLLDRGDPDNPVHFDLMVKLAQTLGRLARYEIADEAGNLAAGWSNPYLELGPIKIEPRDDDFLGNPAQEAA